MVGRASSTGISGPSIVGSTFGSCHHLCCRRQYSHRLCMQTRPFLSLPPHAVLFHAGCLQVVVYVGVLVKIITHQTPTVYLGSVLVYYEAAYVKMLTLRTSDSIRECTKQAVSIFCYAFNQCWWLEHNIWTTWFAFICTNKFQSQTCTYVTLHRFVQGIVSAIGQYRTWWNP